MTYAETQALRQRLTAVRTQDGLREGSWIKGYGGRFRGFSGERMSDFRLNYGGIQFGVDHRLSGSPVLVEVFGGATRGNPDYASGDGKLRSLQAGIYGTYAHPDGFYVDGLLKYTHLRNQFDVLDSQGRTVSGKGSSRGGTVSVEVGQRLPLSQLRAGLALTPHAQISYTRQGGATINASNGLAIDLDSYHSTLGRLGITLDYQMQTGQQQMRFYVKTGVVREFAGSTQFHLNGSPERHSFRGHWWNNGIGMDVQLRERHHFHLELDNATGKRFDHLQVQAGYRWRF